MEAYWTPERLRETRKRINAEEGWCDDSAYAETIMLELLDDEGRKEFAEQTVHLVAPSIADDPEAHMRAQARYNLAHLRALYVFLYGSGPFQM